MEHQIKYAQSGIKSADKKSYSYFLINILLAVVMPLLSMLWATAFEHEPFNWEMIGKWLIFWAIGIRLFTAGINQASNPKFTANIFRMKSQESFVVIRELGFANISMGVMGILSVINDNWRLLAAVTGGMFLGLAGLLHLFKKPESRNEVIAMVYDLFVLGMILLYLAFTLL